MSATRRARPPSVSKGAPWTALIAALVLLVQGAFPTWAVARAIGAGPVLVQMCAEAGERFALPDQTPAERAQHDCCDPAVFAAALPAPAPQVLGQPIRYASPAKPLAVTPDAPSARARDPPRPPSQAPPQTV